MLDYNVTASFDGEFVGIMGKPADILIQSPHKVTKSNLGHLHDGK